MNTGRRSGVGALIPLAYRPAPTITEWARAYLRALVGVIPSCTGAVARVLDLTTKRPLGGYLLHDCRPDVERTLRRAERTSAHRIDLVSHGRGLRTFASEPGCRCGDRYVDNVRRRFRALGMDDMRHLTAADDQLCVTVGAIVPLGARIPGSGAAWLRAAEHFQAGLGLQRRAQRAREELLCAGGAVVSPDGVVLHASGAATTERARARLREIARRRKRVGTDTAEEVWCGVLDGRWSVIDRHAHDGRRYLLAVPIQGPRDPRKLLPGELRVAALAAHGHSDKWIAATLDIKRSTAASHLKVALAKLGAANRIELARTFEARGIPTSGTAP